MVVKPKRGNVNDIAKSFCNTTIYIICLLFLCSLQAISRAPEHKENKKGINVHNRVYGKRLIYTEENRKLEIASFHFRFQQNSMNACMMKIVLNRGVLLSCPENVFLLSHPMNLLGIIHIRNKFDALKYLRIFTNKYTYHYASLNHLVEIITRECKKHKECFFTKEIQKILCYVDDIRELKDKKYGVEVEKEYYNNSYHQTYIITRYLVSFVDKNHVTLYKTVESIREDGYYYILSSSNIDISQESQKEILKNCKHDEK